MTNQNQKHMTYNPDPKRILIVGGFARSGKQQPKSEPVLTPTGWKAIGDLNIGDAIIGSKGKTTFVKGVYPQTDRRVFQVKFNDGSVVKAGADHLWKVITQKQKAKNIKLGGDRHKIMTTQELIDAGLRFSSGNFRFSIPAYEPYEAGINEPNAYAIGYILGNGTVGGDVLYISCHEEIQFKLVDALVSSLGLPLRMAHTSNKGIQMTYSWKTCPESVRCLRDSGRSHEKEMPEGFETWDLESRENLLAGLLDSDGSYTNNSPSVSFSSTSIQLINGVRSLARSTGNWAMQDAAIDNRTYYKSGYCAKLHLRLQKNISRLYDKFKYQGFQFLPIIREITLLPYEEDSVCIEVAADDSLYVTSNYKLTHNTSLINELREEGWAVASTSEVLDSITYSIISTFGFSKTHDFDLATKTGTVVINGVQFNPREIKITVAENIIVPTLTRTALVIESIRRCGNSQKIVCETIGGEELRILVSVIEDYFPSAQIAMLNMRSELELKGVDIRELITTEANPYPVYSYMNTFHPFDSLRDLINNNFFDSPF